MTGPEPAQGQEMTGAHRRPGQSDAGDDGGGPESLQDNSTGVHLAPDLGRHIIDVPARGGGARARRCTPKYTGTLEFRRGREVEGGATIATYSPGRESS